MGHEEKYSRRDFLFGALRKVKRNLRELRSGNQDEEKGRDKAFEYIGEGLSLAAIGYVALEGSRDRLVAYDVNSESKLKDLEEFKGKLETVLKLNKITDPVAKGTTDLSRTWERAYEDTVCDTKASVDSEGNVTTSIDCHTQWNEPSVLTSKGLDSSRIGRWKSQLNGFSELTANVAVQIPESFDLSERDEKLFYTEKEVDSSGQLWSAIPAYAIPGMLFVFYEEGLNKLTQSDYEEPIIHDNLHVKRRTLMKLGTSIFLSSKIRDVQKEFAQGNKDLLAVIKGNSSSVLKKMDSMTPEENFRNFFQAEPNQIRQVLTDMGDKCDQALSAGYEGKHDRYWNEVKAQITASKQKSGVALKEFDAYFSYDEKQDRSYTIPDDLTEVTKYLWASGEIVNFVGSRSSDLNSRHWLNALALTLGLGAVAVAGEAVVFPASDKVLE